MKLIEKIRFLWQKDIVVLDRNTYEVLCSHVGKSSHAFIKPLYPDIPHARAGFINDLRIPRGEEEKFAVAWLAKRNEIIEQMLGAGISREAANAIRTAFMRNQINQTKR